MIVLLAGALGGAIWSGICGWLRARRGTNEVISTIMLNFVAAQILSWTVHGPLMEASRAYPQSMPIASSAEMYMFLAPTRLNLGMLLALALAMYLFLFRSDAGFQLRAMGKNRRAANFFRIPIASSPFGQWRFPARSPDWAERCKSPPSIIACMRKSHRDGASRRSRWRWSRNLIRSAS